MENENKRTFKDFLVSPLGKAAMIIVFYVVILMLFVFLTGVIDAPAVAVAIAVFFAYFGWKALNRITPDMFLFLSFTGWIVYFLIKFFLSIAIGVFVAPFVIAKKISEAVQDNI